MVVSLASSQVLNAIGYLSQSSNSLQFYRTGSHKWLGVHRHVGRSQSLGDCESQEGHGAGDSLASSLRQLLSMVRELTLLAALMASVGRSWCCCWACAFYSCCCYTRMASSYGVSTIWLVIALALAIAQLHLCHSCCYLGCFHGFLGIHYSLLCSLEHSLDGQGLGFLCVYSLAVASAVAVTTSSSGALTWGWRCLPGLGCQLSGN